mmetsp:Transcript_1605/g.2583  ORF Transcript_1605/g.2583 Transcript_1605/m.2583 type:complete len:759 (+) Transcript_1605:20-2296(+)|eukprot:CAMPEP_0197033264 /NCGR_PEP_ID=MMETSP1384-20130603/11718_1 /TAXON_ID=29189 /ORGANISM="Ammonia sp." /LENGTH=758 /DNA_ID=CAMNT_0042463053 /DNA_START=18 /DNA_END=2294 /DNA_ORIENTATION=-
MSNEVANITHAFRGVPDGGVKIDHGEYRIINVKSNKSVDQYRSPIVQYETRSYDQDQKFTVTPSTHDGKYIHTIKCRDGKVWQSDGDNKGAKLIKSNSIDLSHLQITFAPTQCFVFKDKGDGKYGIQVVSSRHYLDLDNNFTNAQVRQHPEDGTDSQLFYVQPFDQLVREEAARRRKLLCQISLFCLAIVLFAVAITFIIIRPDALLLLEVSIAYCAVFVCAVILFMLNKLLSSTNAAWRRMRQQTQSKRENYRENQPQFRVLESLLMANQVSKAQILLSIRNFIDNHIINKDIFSTIFNRYHLQIAILPYFEMSVVLSGFVGDAVDHCTNVDVQIFLCVVFAFFFVVGCVQWIISKEATANSTSRCKSLQSVTSFIGNTLILYILFVSIDIRPWDCYYRHTRLTVISLTIFTLILDKLLNMKRCQKDDDEDAEPEEEEVTNILSEMMQKIEEESGGDARSKNLLMMKQLAMMKSEVNRTKPADETLFRHYFNLSYFYLDEKYDSFLGIVGHYGLVLFVLDLISDYVALPETVDVVFRWLLFVIFLLMALLLSIRQSLYSELPRCGQFLFWTQKRLCSFVFCVSLLLTVDYRPMSYHFDEFDVGIAVIVSLTVSFLGDMLIPQLVACCFVSKTERGCCSAIIGAIESIETPKFLDAAADADAPESNQAQRNEEKKEEEEIIRIGNTLKEQVHSSNGTKALHLLGIGRDEVMSVLRNHERQTENIQECADCQTTREGRVDEYDGTFYCLQCWQEREGTP